MTTPPTPTSPLPWTLPLTAEPTPCAEHSEENWRILNDYDAPHHLCVEGLPREVAETFARLANAHAALVAALRHPARLADGATPDPNDPADWGEAILSARAALAATKGA